jgi:hypothetical protein
MSDSSTQFGRRASLFVIRPEVRGNNPSAFVPEGVIDLSAMHFTFKTFAADQESPNNCVIRIFNLSRGDNQNTVQDIIKGEYSRVILQAGYENGEFAVIFDGNVKQFKVGRLTGTDTYLDLLCADGDLGYNFAQISQSIAAGSTPKQRIDAIVKSMQQYGVTEGSIAPSTGGTLPRGKVLFGMARAMLRQQAASQQATWSIQNGKVNVIPLTGYLPGEPVVLDSLNGMIGMPEQTNDGIRVKCLLNPKILPGQQVRINNRAINQTIQASPGAAPVPFNQWTGIQLLADVTSDGLYRVFVAEHEGDTRGQAWYSELTCLSVDAVSKEIKPYG